MKQLVELGYIEEPNENTDEAVRETTRELKYNLAQSYMDGGRLGEATEILEEIWSDWPREARFGLNLIACLGGLGRVEERGLAIDRLALNANANFKWALEELERLRPEADEYGIKLPRPKVDSAGELAEESVTVDEDADTAVDAANDDAEGEDAASKEPPKKLTFAIRKVMSLLQPMGSTLSWLSMQQAVMTDDHDRARKFLEAMEQGEKTEESLDLQLGIGEARFSMGDIDAAADRFARALEIDDENSSARLGLARVAVAREDWERGIEEALTTTELLFQNPTAHFMLGRSLEGVGDDDHAKIAYGVALGQAPGMIDAREALIGLLDRVGPREEADQHRKTLEEVREVMSRDTAIANDDVVALAEDIRASRVDRRATLDFDRTVEAVSDRKPVVVVSGLPRSGTSMMMQMLANGGVPAFSDGNREADEDNPRGYFEHEKSTRLGSDASWVPEARGQAVKIVAQLLPFLPRGERYRVIFMDRDLHEIVKSQRVMLDRMERKGGRLTDARMMSTLDAQVAQVERLLARRPDIDSIFVDYASVLADPAGETRRIADFLGGEFDVDAMVGGVDKTLRNQGSDRGAATSE
ncbi:MAG: hypothetical protein CMJ22_12090 [Phycisphaerae bacterium]|nr:hypothetical protein [Phycisphaerae bacterium]